MRTLTPCLALASVAVTVLGGTVLTIVEANNYDANHGAGAPIYYLNAGTLAPVGQNIFVQILGGPVGGPLEPTTDRTGNILTIAIGAGSSGPGFFDAGVAVVPGVAPFAQAQFEVRAWQGTEGFDKAAYVATSAIWIQGTGSWDLEALPPPGSPPFAPPWSSLTIVPVPEPPALALALLGGGGVAGATAMAARLKPIPDA